MLLLTIFMGFIIGMLTNYIIFTKEKRREYFIPLVNTFFYVIIFYSSSNYLEQIYISLLSTVFILIAYIDIKEMLISDWFIIAALIISIVYKTLNYILYKQNIELRSSIRGMIIPLVIFSILFFISKGGMGEGDISLAGFIGFILGSDFIMIAILLAFIVFVIVAAVLYFRFNKDINREIPFAPFLIFAFYVTLLYGDQILEIFI